MNEFLKNEKIGRDKFASLANSLGVMNTSLLKMNFPTWTHTLIIIICAMLQRLR